MKLVEQIKHCIEMGFDVSFLSNGFHMEVKVEKNNVEWTSTLPKDNSHLTDERMADVVKFGLDKVWGRLYPSIE